MYEFETVINYPWEYEVLHMGIAVGCLIQHSKYGVTFTAYEDSNVDFEEIKDIEREFFFKVIRGGK